MQGRMFNLTKVNPFIAKIVEKSANQAIRGSYLFEYMYISLQTHYHRCLISATYYKRRFYPRSAYVQIQRLFFNSKDNDAQYFTGPAQMRTTPSK